MSLSAAPQQLKSEELLNESHNKANFLNYVFLKTQSFGQ